MTVLSTTASLIVAVLTYGSDVTLFSAGAEVHLRPSITRVRLAPTRESTPSLATTIDGLAFGRDLYLVLRQLRTPEQPGVEYDVYLDLPEGTEPARTSVYYVGTLNFFNAPKTASSPRLNQSYVSFKITPVVRALRTRGALGSAPIVSLLPTSTPPSDIEPIVGRIEIVDGVSSGSTARRN